MTRTRVTYLLQKALNIETNELWIVKTLFLHHFFQGFGLALLTIIGQAAFLSAYPIKQLPLVFILSGGLLLLTGRIYAKLEHALSLKSLFTFAVAFNLLLALLCWMGMFYFTAITMAVVLMVGYRIVYTIGNLEFWGLSAVLFDVRQSKRLFGLISAGDVPAKLIGYSIVYLLAPYLGLENLLLLVALSFMLSFYFMHSILSKEPLHEEDSGHSDHSHHGHAHESFLQKLIGTKFVLTLALLSFIAIFTLTIIDISFLTGVKKRFNSDIELAGFLGLFFALGQGFTILMKFFLSGRIIDRLGVRRALLILPVVLLLISLLFIAERISGFPDKYIFWLFGLMMMASEVLQYALNGPVFLALFQPMSSHDRLKGHTFVKGFSDPIALSFAGAVLYFVFKLFPSPEIFLQIFTYGITLLTIVWLITTIYVNRHYLNVLRNAMRRRFLSGSQIQVADKDSVNILKEKLKSQFPEEVIYALELLKGIEVEDLQEIEFSLLKHPEKEIRKRAMESLIAPLPQAVKNNLLEILQSTSATDEIVTLIDTWCRVAEDDIQEMYPFLQHENLKIRSRAIIGLIQTGQIEAVVLSGQALLFLIESSEKTERIVAAEVLGQLKIMQFYQPLEKFLAEDNEAVVISAIKAAGKTGNLKLFPKVVALLNHQPFRIAVLREIPMFGEVAIRFIKEQLAIENIPVSYKLELIKLSAHFHALTENLIALTQDYDMKVRTQALITLHEIAYVSDDLKSWEMYLQKEFDLTQTFNQLILCTQEAGEAELSKSLTAERLIIKKRILSVIGFISPKDSLSKALQGLQSGEKNKVANALEMIDNLLPNRISTRLIPLLQNNFLTVAGQNEEFRNVNEALLFILTKASSTFGRWTIACALNRIADKDYPELREKALIFKNHSDLLLREIVPSIEVLLNPKNKIIMDKLNLLLIEKIIVLRNTELFSETPEEILVEVAEAVKTVYHSKDEKIVEKGDVGDCMYIIFQGEVNILDEEHILGSLKRRDFFGELALLDPAPRSATIVAKEDCILLSLDQKTFYELIESRAEVGRGILKVLAKRIRNADEQIATLKKEINNQK